jgi:AcrR family transcriptional regulator
MPKAFSAAERATIERALLAHGRRLFAAQGLRKTSVEELAAAAGVSKGAFYLFFASKEELFFTLLEQYEAQFQALLLQQIARAELPPRARMAALLERALAAWHADPLFARFGRAEYEQLLLRLPPERVAAQLAADEAFAARFAAAWAAQGVALAEDPPMVTALIRALFYLSLHEEEFGALAPAVLAAHVAMLAARLVPAEGGHHDRG